MTNLYFYCEIISPEDGGEARHSYAHSFDRMEILHKLSIDRETLELYLEDLYPTYFSKDDGISVWYRSEIYLTDDQW